jgi:hypothetical protein
VILFCRFGKLAERKGCIFCLRLKKNHCIETEHLVWQRLDELGIVPGTSLYFQGKRVRKTQPATGFDVACKWKRNYGHGRLMKRVYTHRFRIIASSYRCLQATDGY